MTPVDRLLEEALGHHQAGRLAEAVSRYQQLLLTRPKHPVALCYLGVALGQTGRLEEAVEHLKKALAIQPDFFDAHINLGKAFENRADSRMRWSATSTR